MPHQTVPCCAVLPQALLRPWDAQVRVDSASPLRYYVPFTFCSGTYLDVQPTQTTWLKLNIEAGINNSWVHCSTKEGGSYIQDFLPVVGKLEMLPFPERPQRKQISVADWQQWLIPICALRLVFLLTLLLLSQSPFLCFGTNLQIDHWHGSLQARLWFFFRKPG